jgi:hypothetical protein
MSRTPVEVVALSDLVESTPTRSCAYGSWDGRLRVSQAMSRSRGPRGARGSGDHLRMSFMSPILWPRAPKLIPSPQIA